MSPIKNPYIRHRFPPEVISHAVWLYHRFTLSFRDIEELLAIRDIHTSYESIRRWCLKFPSHYSKKLHKQQGRLGDLWYLMRYLSLLEESASTYGVRLTKMVILSML